jgi:FkbM family methyltransferase
LARFTGPHGKAYAVEPAPENLEYLRKNIQLNGLINVEVLPYAAGASYTSRDFHPANGKSSDISSFYSTQLDDTQLESCKTMHVQQIALDEITRGRVILSKLMLKVLK